jgi:hypothetical protein
MEKPVFTRPNLSDVRVIMVIMHVLVVELLCQTAMGQISVFKYLKSGVRRCLWPCLVLPNIKCHRFPRSRLSWCFPGTECPRAWMSGAQVCAELGG